MVESPSTSIQNKWQQICLYIHNIQKKNRQAINKTASQQKREDDTQRPLTDNIQ